MALTKISGTVGPRSSNSAKQSDSERARLLYVEDNDANWEVAQLLLKGTYRLSRARNAKEAVSHLETSGFDLILMDIELGGSDLDGIQLTQLFRGTLPNPPSFASTLKPVDTPIVFVTAYTARYGDSELQAKGGDGVVHKPVDPPGQVHICEHESEHGRQVRLNHARACASTRSLLRGATGVSPGR